jgi:hypothetical protein
MKTEEWPLATSKKSGGAAREVKIKNASRFGMVLVADLKVDPEAQRKLSMPWVKERVSTFDVDQLGYIVVNRREEGGTYVVDGMHRVELMRQVGWGDQNIHAEIFDGLTQAEEAELFNARNDRRAVRKYDRFRIAFTARDEQAVAITRIVHRAGFVISDQAGDGHIASIEALERIYTGGGIGSTTEGAEALGRTLNMVGAAWGKTYASVQGDIIRALGMVNLRYAGNIDEKALIKKLSSFSGGPSGLVGRGRSLKELSGRPIFHCIASIVVDLYNRGRRVGNIEPWEAA